MKTIKPEKFFKDIIKDYKTKYFSYHEVKIFNIGLQKIRNGFLSQFGNEEIDGETFGKKINSLQKWWWKDNTPFGMFYYSETEKFFEKNCIGISYIYEEMVERGIDFPLTYNENRLYHNMILHLQKYCFDFITKDFE